MGARRPGAISMSCNAPDLTRPVTLVVGLEGVPPPEVMAAVFVFDASGALISHAPLRQGAATVHVPTTMTALARIVVGPAPKLGQAFPTIDTLARLRPYQPVFDFRETADRHRAPPVPELYWRYWLWCECRVRGHVVRTIDGLDVPVGQARVHICRVEPFFIFLNRLPDADVLRLRDDFEAALTSPALPPPPPGPVNARDVVPGLRSRSPAVVRQTLIESLVLLRPYWRLWPWWWWWPERCVEIAVATTDALGRFDLEYWNLCEDDNDLYFRVEPCIDGVWTPVDGPLAPDNTYWDYVCGTEVSLCVIDEQTTVFDAGPV